MTETDALQRLAIRDLVERYFAGVDRKDRSLVLSCFTDDCLYEFAVEGRSARGRAELEKVFGGRGSRATAFTTRSSRSLGRRPPPTPWRSRT
jgi:ketosteroid isomerase-like protein